LLCKRDGGAGSQRGEGKSDFQGKREKRTSGPRSKGKRARKRKEREVFRADFRTKVKNKGARDPKGQIRYIPKGGYFKR